ncbi:MAG TPA: tripartite tricarboxylate transporter TctB family protein [Candidatus Saccharimonadales bacterium]|nr:tripartite tricarboxylate transporter TctB family protein [Candidatus Saccharimonadales bacterium]
MTTDRASASVLVLFALLVIWESRLLPLGSFRQPGPAYVPVLLASLLLIFGVLLILTAGRAPSLSSLRWTEWRHALAILAACVFAVFAIERVGYRLTMLLVLGFLVKFVERRGWVLSLTFAFSLAFGSFFLFYTLLRVPLPQGPWGF